MRSAPLAANRTTEPHHSPHGAAVVAPATPPGLAAPGRAGAVLHPESWGRHRWGKTPDLAPLDMDARRFELVSFRAVLRSATRRLRVAAGAVSRLSDAGTRA